MDPLALVLKAIVGIALIVVGILWVLVRFADAAAGDPNEGALGGWLSVGAGLAVAIGGVLILIF